MRGFVILLSSNNQDCLIVVVFPVMEFFTFLMLDITFGSGVQDHDVGAR